MEGHTLAFYSGARARANTLVRKRVRALERARSAAPAMQSEDLLSPSVRPYAHTNAPRGVGGARGRTHGRTHRRRCAGCSPTNDAAGQLVLPQPLPSPGLARATGNVRGEASAAHISRAPRGVANGDAHKRSAPACRDSSRHSGACACARASVSPAGLVGGRVRPPVRARAQAAQCAGEAHKSGAPVSRNESRRLSGRPV